MECLQQAAASTSLRFKDATGQTVPLYTSLFKGKLAHNFIISNLVLISCLSDMVRTYITKDIAKFNKYCSYREKKIKFGNSESLGFPISPCATSL